MFPRGRKLVKIHGIARAGSVRDTTDRVCAKPLLRIAQLGRRRSRAVSRHRSDIPRILASHCEPRCRCVSRSTRARDQIPPDARSNRVALCSATRNDRAHRNHQSGTYARRLIARFLAVGTRSCSTRSDRLALALPRPNPNVLGARALTVSSQPRTPKRTRRALPPRGKTRSRYAKTLVAMTALHGGLVPWSYPAHHRRQLQEVDDLTAAPR